MFSSGNIKDPADFDAIQESIYQNSVSKKRVLLPIICSEIQTGKLKGRSLLNCVSASLTPKPCIFVPEA